jgi:hypothetical protein
MRVLSDGRPRSNLAGVPLGLFLSGVVVLACIGAFMVARARVEWLT